MLIQCHSTSEPLRYFWVATGRCFSFTARVYTVCALLWRSDANNVVNVIISDNRQMKPRLYRHRDLLRYTEWQRMCVRVCVCLRWLKHSSCRSHSKLISSGRTTVFVIFPHMAENKEKNSLPSYQMCSRLCNLPKWVINRRKPKSSSRCSDPTLIGNSKWFGFYWKTLTVVNWSVFFNILRRVQIKPACQC